LALRLKNGEITIRQITVVNDDDEFEMDEESRVVSLVQQLRLVTDDFTSRQIIKKSGQAKKLNRLEKEEIDKLSKRIHSQIQWISFNQNQIEKFTELLVQQAREIECASEQIAELEQSQRVDSKKVLKKMQSWEAANKAGDVSKEASLQMGIEDFAGQSFKPVLQEYQLLESAMKWKRDVVEQTGQDEK